MMACYKIIHDDMNGFTIAEDSEQRTASSDQL